MAEQSALATFASAATCAAVAAPAASAAPRPAPDWGGLERAADKLRRLLLGGGDGFGRAVLRGDGDPAPSAETAAP
ncbi:hypothetical protein ACFSLT_09080 [Novosphingobium resinovorum]